MKLLRWSYVRMEIRWGNELFRQNVYHTQFYSVIRTQTFTVKGDILEKLAMTPNCLGLNLGSTWKLIKALSINRNKVIRIAHIASNYKPINN